MEVADLLIPFCDAGSVSCKVGGARRRIVVSLAFVDVHVLYAKVFGDRSHLVRTCIRPTNSGSADSISRSGQTSSATCPR